MVCPFPDNVFPCNNPICIAVRSCNPLRKQPAYPITQQESSIYHKQLHNLSIRLFRLPLLYCRRYHLRLLLRPPWLFPDPGSLLRTQDVSILLYFWLPLARLYCVHLWYPHQYRWLCGCYWKTSPQRRNLHLQLELLLRIHCCVCDLLHFVQAITDSGMFGTLDGGWR